MAGAARHVGDQGRNVAVPLVVVVGVERGDGEEVLRRGDGGRLGDGIERRKRWGEACEGCQPSSGQDVTLSHGSLTPSMKSIKILGLRGVPAREERE